MSKIRVMSYSFVPSGSSDVIEYKLYYTDSIVELSYSSPSISLGLPIADTDGKMRIDLVALNTFTQDSNCNFGIVAVDDVGNESSMLQELDVPFDLVAPDAPTNGVVERE